METESHHITVDRITAETPVIPAVEDGPPIERIVPLTGWFERQGFHPLLTAFLMFVVSFLLFQGLASVIAIAVFVSREGMTSDAATLLEAMEAATGPLLIGNTVGQFLGMAVPVLLWTGLHTHRPSGFLRISAPDWRLLGLSVLALVGLLPVIQWLGEVNSTLPLPDFLDQLEQAQLELIERILASDISLWGSVFALAITPAICEELLFRGYLQRQLERSFGVVGGILFTGLLFGLYHFRLSQAVPLAVLGVFLGWLVWRTGSLWVPVVVHFFNNAFAVAASAMAAANPEWGIEDVEHIDVPAGLIVGGALVVFGAIVLMNRRVEVLAVSKNGEET